METIKNFFRFLFFNQTNPLSEADSFKDDAGTEKPFKPHYDKYILPHVIEFEAKRIETLKSFRSRVLIVVALCGFLLALLFIFVPVAKALNFLGHMAFLFSIIGIFAYQPIRKYKSSVKSIIFPKIFSFFGNNYTYSKEGPVSASAIKEQEIFPDYYSAYLKNHDKGGTLTKLYATLSNKAIKTMNFFGVDYANIIRNSTYMNQFKDYGILPSYTEVFLEDYIKGSYKEIIMEFFLAKLSKTSTVNKKSNSSIVFQGMIICFSMNKNFNGKTIVTKDSGIIGNWLEDKLSNLQIVNLEDPTFENQFQVYSTDQIEARYLLTTSFMERLLTLSSMFNNKMECSFYNNKLLFAIKSMQDTFKTSSIFLPSTFEYDIKTVLIEMQAIFNIIDTLKLSEKTGL